MNIPIEIIGLVVGAFLSILGFGFLVIWNNTKAINSINVTLSAMNEKDNMGEREHGSMNTKLNEHSAKIEAHGLILAEHEVKIKEILK